MSDAGEKINSSNHAGRSGEPLALVIGDEAVPSVVGHTVKGGQSSCCWVLKKEHLGLEEVARLLAKINQEKKDWDKECGRRGHDFFIPNGSKILFGSYVHLRKERLEGYIGDFNNMVRDVWQVMGGIGVEVLPFLPVVYKGLDSLGGKLYRPELRTGFSGWLVRSLLESWQGQAGRRLAGGRAQR